MQNRDQLIAHHHKQVIDLISLYIPEEDHEEIELLIKNKSLDQLFIILKNHYPFTPFPHRLTEIKTSYELSLQPINQQKPARINGFLRGTIPPEKQFQYDQHSITRRFGNLV